MMPDPSVINVIQREMARQFEEPPPHPRRSRPDPEEPQPVRVAAPRRTVARVLRAIAQRIEPAPPARATT